MAHDVVADWLWPGLYRQFLPFQVAALDAGGAVVAVGNSLPLHWDGPFEDLPDEGWDWVMEKGFADHAANVKPTIASAVSIAIRQDWQGQGISGQLVQAMRAIAHANGLKALIAPVRPSLKHRYPLMPMEQYVTWRRPDGLPADPWMRVHARLGARVVKVCPRAMLIEGDIAEWQTWVGMEFPFSGTYVVPFALVPVEVDHALDRGRYVEPNVWMVHALDKDV